MESHSLLGKHRDKWTKKYLCKAYGKRMVARNSYEKELLACQYTISSV